MIKEDSSEEVLAIYDEDGNLKGSQLREEAHAASEWHAVSHVYLFDVQGRLLLQKRASHLQQSPGALQVSVSGHVASDESPDLAALRKGYEELGIHLDPSRLKKMAVLKRSYAYKADAAWQNREFAFIYVYQVTDEEIAEMEKNYNLLASEELWLIPSDVVAGMVFKNPKQFSNSVRGVVNERPELWKVLSEKGTETPMNDGLASKNVLGWHEQTLISLGDYARFAELNSEKKNAIRNILGFLKQDNRSIRSMAYRTLRRIPQAAPFLLELASDEDPETASLAMISLSFLLRKRGLLPEGEEIQRAEIHEALFQRIKRVLLPFSEMSDALEDKDQTKLERSALQALGYLDHAETADLFARKLARIDGDDDEFLGSKLLEAAAASDSAGVRRQVLEAFARLAREMPIEKIPLELSRLLDAKWMSDYLQDLPGLRLAKRFGYIDQALYKAAQAPEGEAIFPVMRKLIAQVGVATQTLTTRYLAEPEDSRETLVEGWRQKQLDWMRMFLPEELTPVPALKPVSVELTETGEIGRDLFFGALRESDWANAEDKRETPPFGYEHQEKHGGRFYYAGRDLFQFLWEDKLKRAKTIMGESVSEDVLHVLMPYYAADAMAIETETRKEPREEAAARVSGRWRAVAGLLEVHEGRLILKPEMAKRISLEADLPRGQVGVSLEDRAALSDFISRLAANRSVWKYALLDFQAMSRANLFMARAQRDPDWQTLSFGSRSALKLYAYDLTKNSPHTNDELWPEWEVKFKQLAGEEGRNRGIMPSLPLRGGKDKDADSAVGVMPSLGMELQSVNISPAQVYLWKQALPFFDIPSPERLRYGHIVETAFRPAWTASAFLLALPILHRMGLMGGEHYKSAAAFHISLSGDLGAEARWIALPLLMYRGDKTDKDLTLEERASRSAWVLSKGYIHRNRENQKADPESEAPQFHTEIRTARFANVEKGNAELLGDYEKFLPAVQYLGAALTAFKKTERPEVVLTDIEKTLSQVWREYQDALSVIVSEIPEAQNLMNADWYESTGDAKDAALVKQLDIFKRIVALFEYKKQNMEVYEGFAERVKKILLDYAGQAQMAVAGQAARSEVRSFSSGSREQRPEASKIREERVRPKERMAEKIFRQEPVYRKVLLKYRDIADNFTGTNSGRLHELAVLAARYPQVRFQIYEADFEDAHYLEIRKLFKAMTNVRFQAQPGGAGLSLSQPGREEANEKILHLSTQAFDARQRFGAKVKKIHFMRTGSSRGALAAALLYNPEHWLFRTRMHKQGDFWVLGSSLARLGRQWLAGFVIAASA